MALSELEQKLREQLKRCDLGLSKGCRGEDNPDGRCQYCDDPYCCLVDTFIRDCLGMPYPWGDEEEVDWSDLGIFGDWWVIDALFLLMEYVFILLMDHMMKLENV